MSDSHLVSGTRVGNLKLAAVALVQAQRQSDSIRLENLSKRALADWKVRVPAGATAFCIDTVFVLDMTLLPCAGPDEGTPCPSPHRPSAKVCPSCLQFVALDSKHNAWAAKWHAILGVCVCWCVRVCVEGAGGGGEQDVLQTLPVSFACINCKSCRILRDEMASPWLFAATC